MDDVALANYSVGLHHENIEAWRVDGLIAAVLRIRIGTVVWLSDYNLTKIGFEHFRKLPRILADGVVVRGRHRTAEIFAVNLDAPMKAVLKATRSGEVFLTTLHRIRCSEVRRLYRKAKRSGALVRDVENDLARRLLHRAS